jgi:hypothetical protein
MGCTLNLRTPLKLGDCSGALAAQDAVCLLPSSCSLACSHYVAPSDSFPLFLWAQRNDGKQSIRIGPEYVGYRIILVNLNRIENFSIFACLFLHYLTRPQISTVLSKHKRTLVINTSIIKTQDLTKLSTSCHQILGL